MVTRPSSENIWNLRSLLHANKYNDKSWRRLRLLEEGNPLYNTSNILFQISQFVFLRLADPCVVLVNYNRTVKFSQLNDPLSLHKTNLRGPEPPATSFSDRHRDWLTHREYNSFCPSICPPGRCFLPRYSIIR